MPVSAGLDLKLDVNGFFDRCQNMGRAEAVRNALEEMSQQLRVQGVANKYYILVLSLTQVKDCDLRVNKIYYESFHWKQGRDAHTFGVWVFTDGYLDHTSQDGGWENWGFTGGKRSGKQNGYVTWESQI